mmetsp:Transcript_18981/g.44065  ORF Transcript_18981/g.44065 Transcript_18981/m.44065 type:complete len:811 (-) Transcript_18981:144-2576(-)|eukprot:CAMPEP_0197185584 /NCGR_PEP_ID=MMETSP1423-20130617/12251_1 /TAXON_ID=476441 /ORGANISM="Pseudo-nitzschia heimii, Strain UNC1101" /LENGTH=810 /DNA_ID=CAMNT_0042636691 /DNA_START=308 /DNA_END=2740 /DNA_ORIENTATION=+
MDLGHDDLVLHEGNGKIQRPSELKTNGKRAIKLRKMPSPRKLSPTTTTTARLNSKADSSKAPLASQNTEEKMTTGEASMEEYRLKSNLMTSNVSSEGEFDGSHRSHAPSVLTTEDIEICQRLDDEYERALEERDISYNARYTSVRQTAIVSIIFLALYMIQGTLVYRELLLINHKNNYVSRFVDGDGDAEEFDNEFSAWSLPESLFFSIFTITTVGYGREDLPTTPSFQAYTILYIMVGIAALTIVVAQVYQCIALEASRARLSQDKQGELHRRSGLMLEDSKQHKISVSSTGQSNKNRLGGKSLRDRKNSDEIILPTRVNVGLVPRTVDCFFRSLDRAKNYFRENELGRGMSVIFPLVGLVLSGAVVVWFLEGWTFLESLYFAVVSLTTVGYGDYVPTKLPTIWFCILWLPFSIGFMSIYLGNVATFYIRLSDRNIHRIERNLRRRFQRAKEKAEQERAEILRRAYRGQEIEIELAAGVADGGSDENLSIEFHRKGSMDSNDTTEDLEQATIPKNHARSVMKRNRQEGFNMLPSSDDLHDSDDEIITIGAHTGSRKTGYDRRQMIIENCRVLGSSSNQGVTGDCEETNDNNEEHNNALTMKSMKDVISAVRNTLGSRKDGTYHQPGTTSDSNASKFMTIQSTQNMIDYSIFRQKTQSKKPSFALRVLVQERFAEIIAIEVAGYHSSIEIKDYTMSVTIDSTSDTAQKWSIPRRARKAFRAVAFEVLYCVGEHGLITRGADALYDLTPFEFHGLFSKLVAAMGDADFMEGWLAKTDALAMVDLQRAVLQRSAPDHNEGGGGLRKRVFSMN